MDYLNGLLKRITKTDYKNGLQKRITKTDYKNGLRKRITKADYESGLRKRITNRIMNRITNWITNWISQRGQFGFGPSILWRLQFIEWRLVPWHDHVIMSGHQDPD